MQLGALQHNVHLAALQQPTPRTTSPWHKATNVMRCNKYLRRKPKHPSRDTFSYNQQRRALAGSIEEPLKYSVMSSRAVSWLSLHSTSMGCTAKCSGPSPKHPLPAIQPTVAHLVPDPALHSTTQHYTKPHNTTHGGHSLPPSVVRHNYRIELPRLARKHPTLTHLDSCAQPTQPQVTTARLLRPSAAKVPK